MRTTVQGRFDCRVFLRLFDDQFVLQTDEESLSDDIDVDVSSVHWLQEPFDFRNVERWIKLKNYVESITLGMTTMVHDVISFQMKTRSSTYLGRFI